MLAYAMSIGMLLFGLYVIEPRFVPFQPVPKRIMAAELDISNFRTALDKFQGDCGRYPTTDEGLRALIKRPTGIAASSWRGPYLAHPEIPLDPWGHSYLYRYPGVKSPEKYDVFSAGPKGHPGDNEEIGNWTPQQQR